MEIVDQFDVIGRNLQKIAVGKYTKAVRSYVIVAVKQRLVDQQRRLSGLPARCDFVKDAYRLEMLITSRLKDDDTVDGGGWDSIRMSIDALTRVAAQDNLALQEKLAKLKRRKRKLIDIRAEANRPFSSLEVGSVGTLNNLKVINVIDRSTLLVEIQGTIAGEEDTDVMLKGFATAPLHDGQLITPPRPLDVIGTTSYMTVLHAKNTVPVLMPAVGVPSESDIGEIDREIQSLKRSP